MLQVGLLSATAPREREKELLRGITDDELIRGMIGNVKVAARATRGAHRSPARAPCTVHSAPLRLLVTVCMLQVAAPAKAMQQQKAALKKERKAAATANRQQQQQKDGAGASAVDAD